MNTNFSAGNKQTLKVLRVDSSGRTQNSTTRELTDLLLEQLGSQEGALDVTIRDVAGGLPLVNEEWINANFTDPEQRSERQREVLAYSDKLVRELVDADILVIGAPIYNFGIPAALKAWVDMIARARVTFRYSENGPVGLLTGKRAILVVASGGTPVGSSIDFASTYLRHVLAFVGITDVATIAAERIMVQGEAARVAAVAEIMKLACADQQLAA